jgi:predicted nucleotidyltransferase
MTREQAIDRLREHEAELKGAGVKHLFLFGSTVRNEARPQSDVDLFFDYEKGAFGLFALVGVKDLATEILGSPADVMTRDSLHPALRSRIEAEAQRIF